MAKVTYLEGDTEQFGFTFTAGKATEVPEGPALVKFRGNPFFAVGGDAKPVKTEPDSALVASHRGAGKFAVMRGEDVVLPDLTKTDAEDFNALSDEDKEAFVATDD